MSFISDTFHQKKLDNSAIRIQTKYIVGNKILERNTDNSLNDDIKSGVLCEKAYYIHQKLVHKETNFDTRIEYTFLSKEEENKDYKCPNCGMIGKVKDFIDGCPYCDTYYNIDYTEKDLGSKYHYDRVLRSTKYRMITAIIDIICCFILSFFFMKTTSRTFNSYDIYKILIYGSILAAILYHFFLIADAYIILGPIKRYKDKQNQKQVEFWKKTNLDKRTFFNNLNYEVGKKYYEDSNIIDYDILDYLSFREFYQNKIRYVEVKLDVRIVSFQNQKISSHYQKQKIMLRQHNQKLLDIKGGMNLMKCHNCGASLDITKGYCDYCHSSIKYFQEWILESIE